MFEWYVYILIILMCIVFEGFFSGSETAMVSVDRSHLKALGEKGSRKASLIYSLLENPERFFSTTLLGTNIMVVLSNTLATFMIIECLGIRYEYITILIMSPILLLFGEIVPKTIFRYYAEPITERIIYPLRIISTIFYPFVMIFSGATKCFIKLLSFGKTDVSPLTTREDIEHYLEMWKREGVLKLAEKKMINRIFDFSETKVEDIMIPLVLIKALEVNDLIEKARDLAVKTGYSRLPVYDEKMHNIIGIVHTFDLIFAGQRAKRIKDLMRPARYVPNTIPIDELLLQLQKEGNNMAVVVDEYGGTVGIITIEDILEEVVGEIRDEYDKERSWFVRLSDRKFLVKARMEIDELNEQLHLDLPKEDYETLGGFLLKHMGRIPLRGETFQYSNIKFIIKRSDRRSIKEVIIERRDQNL